MWFLRVCEYFLSTKKQCRQRKVLLAADRSQASNLNVATDNKLIQNIRSIFSHFNVDAEYESEEDSDCGCIDDESSIGSEEELT